MGWNEAQITQFHPLSVTMMPYPINMSNEWRAISYLQNNTQTHTPTLKLIQNLYNNKDNKGLSVITMEFFILPFATHNLHIKHQTRATMQKISARSARV